MIGVSGIGLLSAAGAGVEPLWSRVKQGETLCHSGTSRIPLDGSAIEFGEAAAKMALADARWNGFDAFILATTVGQAPLWESGVGSFLRSPSIDFKGALLAQPLEQLAAEISSRLGFSGRTLVVSSACSASTQAIAIAAEWVRLGMARRCLVGGVEVLSQVTTRGFSALQLISETAPRPFDAGRTGIHLSEAAAFLCVGAEATLARISGWGMSTDAYHSTSPHPQGAGSLAAMRAALSRAGLASQDLSWIHAHGTGSQANDSAEAIAIGALLEGAAVPVSSTKGVHGHTLAASGALEVILDICALRDGTIPGNAGLVEKDPAIVIPIQSRTEHTPVRHVLKNTLGFGGNNAALVISGVDVR